MTEYDDDKAKLAGLKKELLDKFLRKDAPKIPEEDLPGPLLSGPQTREAFEQLMAEIEQSTDDEDEDENHE
jgi:hypothetical protein